MCPKYARVVDIREQYPLLPIEETIDIANSLGIEHPTDPFTGVKTVMTTDFLITLDNGQNNNLMAFNVKYTIDLNSERNIEKFEIERRYWKRQGVDWQIITEHQRNKIMADNIKFIRNYYNLNTCGLFSDFNSLQIGEFVRRLRQNICGPAVSVRDVCQAFDCEVGFELGNSLALFKHLVITRQINVDIKNMTLELVKPISITLMQSDESRERAV